MSISYDTSDQEYKVIIPSTQSQFLSMNQELSISYNISEQQHNVIIPMTQDQILAINQNFVPNIAIESSESSEDTESYEYNPYDFYDSSHSYSFAPIRNYHNFSVFYHDDDNSFYFSPNYDYDKDSISEYQQIIIKDKSDDEHECSEGLYWENIF